MSRILVIRRDNIGDLVCTTPLLAALRKCHPDGHIAALVNSYNVGVLAGNPDVDAVHAYTKLKHRRRGESWLGTLLATRRMLSRLRRPTFDHVILAKSGYDPHGLALARRVRPRNIVGFAPDEAVDRNLHEVEVVMKLGARLGVTEPPGPVRVFAAPERVAHWRSRFPSWDGQWLAVHISGRVPGKVWPTYRFIELVKRLSDNKSTGIVLLWAPGAADDPRHPGDDAKAAAIASAAGAGVMLLPAKTATLEDLIAVLSLCHAFIGPDGGAMHIAAGLGLRVVALFENLPYQERHWHPWQVPYEIVMAETRDIADIPVDRVVQAWSRLAVRRP
jgi:ADP-heptose:LPS heptosyltransferase